MKPNVPSRIRRAFAIAIAIAGALIASLPVAVAAQEHPRAAHGASPATAPAPCTVVIPIDEGMLDGAKNLADVGPGAVICLAAGTRGNIRVANLHGTVEQPITIRNEGGRVLLTGTRFDAAIYIVSSSGLHITGTGVESQCGAEFSTAEQHCGIEIDGATKGIKVATARGEAGELEIDHIAIHRVSSDKETRGIAIHPVDRQVISGIRIHHNFISNTLAEGIYIGSDPRDKPYEVLGKVERVEIAYNRLEQIGWDGIKLKVAVTPSSIHHNVVRDAALASYPNHESGITVAMSIADVYSNTVLRTVEGIQTGRPLESPGNRYYNNLVADVETSGIDTADDGALIYNNTVVRSGGFGIRARGEASRLTDNIIADAETPITVRSTSINRANLVASASEIGFADPDNEDFTLTAVSPAVDRGRIVNRDVCIHPGMRVARPVNFALRVDRDGGSRPLGCRSDLGAFELVLSIGR